MGRERVWAGAGRAWRYVGTTGIWFDPMLTVQCKEQAKTFGEKETPLGEKEIPGIIPLGDKRQNWRKSEFCWQKNTSYAAEESERKLVVIRPQHLQRQ